MPLTEIGGIIVAYKNRAALVFPHQHLLREVDGGRLRRLHQRGTRFGVAEDKQCGGAQREFGALGVCSVVDGGDDL